jgi:hypothetical protein
MNQCTPIYQPGALYCANPDCGAALGVDHVTVTTTTHVRRFCGMWCVARGYILSRLRLEAEIQADASEAEAVRRLDRSRV